MTISRGEWFGLFAAVLLGSFLRLGYPAEIGVSHFDEGVYASNFWFGDDMAHRFPNRHLYAPPLLPDLIELLFLLAAPGQLTAAAVSLIAGIALIPSLWWVTRSWVSPAAGLIAAWLCAGSTLHAILSRSALTDALLCLFLLWSLHFAWKSLRSASFWNAAIAGLFCGAAWWTKYNGWLPIAITAATVCGLGVSTRQAGPFIRQLLTGLLMATIAIAVWLPVLNDLQATGGFAAVSANHRGYVVGPAGYGGSLTKQFSSARMGIGTSELVCVAIAAWLALLPRPGHCFTWNVTARNCGVGAAWVALTAALGPVGLAVTASLGQLTIWIRGCLTGPRAASNQPAGIPQFNAAQQFNPGTITITLLAVWSTGLLVATPMYTPYPRLLLPWLVVSWIIQSIAMAAAMSTATTGTDGTSPAQPPTGASNAGFNLALPLVVLVLLAAGIGSGLGRTSFPMFGSSTGMATAAVEIRSVIEAAAKLPAVRVQDQAAVYVYGEPAMLFQLRLVGMEIVVPVSHLNFAKPTAARPRLPTFVVIGPHARDSRDFCTRWNESKLRLRFIQRFHVQRSPTVALDAAISDPTGANATDGGTTTSASNCITVVEQSGADTLELYRVE